MKYESINNTKILISDFNEVISEFNKDIAKLKSEYDSEYMKIVKLERDYIFDLVTKKHGHLGKVTKFNDTVRLTFKKKYNTMFRSAYQFSQDVNDEIGVKIVKSIGSNYSSNSYGELKVISFELTAGYIKTKYNFQGWKMLTNKLKRINSLNN